MVVSVHVILRSRHISALTCRVLHKIRHVEADSSCKRVNFARYLSTTIPKTTGDLRFSAKHEWILYDGKVGTVGISDHAQDSLGEVVYAQLPDVGTVVKKDDECGALESVKAASELYSPISGKVVEKNTSVEEKPGLINKSCYKEGWLFKVELTKPEELEKLMTEADYKEFLKSEEN